MMVPLKLGMEEKPWQGPKSIQAWTKLLLVDVGVKTYFSAVAIVLIFVSYHANKCFDSNYKSHCYIFISTVTLGLDIPSFARFSTSASIFSPWWMLLVFIDNAHVLSKFPSMWRKDDMYCSC